MNEDMPERKTIVIGGSYPGALSAWFRYTYPDIAIAAWAASAVVQPWEDMWSYDEQIYQSTHNYDPSCATSLQRMNTYATEQAILRNRGEANDIDTLIVGTPAEGMPSAEFLQYVGDFPAGFVQYGNTTGLCADLAPYVSSTD